MQSVCLKVIMEAVSQGKRSQKLRRLLSQFTDLFGSPMALATLFFPYLQKDWGIWSPWGKFLRQRNQVYELIYVEISDRRSNRANILSLLIEARDEIGEALNENELRNKLISLLIAGHETTATAMTWSLYWLNRSPDNKEKLFKELANSADSPEPIEIFHLASPTAVCYETLQISLVAMSTFPKVTQEPSEILGDLIAQGTLVIGCIYLTLQREDFDSNPCKSRPKRFLERKYSSHKLIPFEGGVLPYLGETLAKFEMKLVLETILSGYKLKLWEKQPEKSQHRGLTLSPSLGVKIIKSKLLDNKKTIFFDSPQRTTQLNRV